MNGGAASPSAPWPDREADLDRWILLRLEMAGVELSLLPEEAPEAPVDRRRVLAAARAFLGRTPPALRSLPFAESGPVPLLYPASLGPDPDPGRGEAGP